MTSTDARSFPTFTEYFAAVHGGHTPYGWQSELASRLPGDGWPSVIEVPTGLGKTTTIATAVFELARQCHARRVHRPDGSLPPRRTAPQRIFHVVNRRSLVDDTGDYVGALAAAINDAVPGSTLAPVREALTELLGEGSTVPVVGARIHGASPRQGSWLRATGCTIVTLTPHQLVSRLVMRGFGVSNGARPIHAALVGIDRLVLVDEPHLAVPTIHTLADAEALQRAAPTTLGIPLGQTVLLGATVPYEAARLVSTRTRTPLAAASLSASTSARASKEYARRLGAIRTLEVQRTSTVSDTAFVKKLVACAVAAWVDGNRRVAVMVNTVAVAQAVHAALPGALHAVKSAAPTTLVTSRFRPVDRPVVGLGEAGITVATQCLEVGVDVSFDALVTELCSWDALVQRLGRLNRDGSATQAMAYLVTAPRGAVRAGARAVYGDTLGALSAVIDDAGEGAVIDVSRSGLDALRARAEALDITLATPVPRSGTLHRGLVPLMVQTRPSPVPDLPVDALVSGPDASPSSDILVAWRSHPGLLAPGGAQHVRAAESVAVPRTALLSFLAAEPGDRTHVTDLETLAEEVPPRYVAAQADLSKLRVWDPQSESWTGVRDLGAVAVARRAVLPCAWGGYDMHRGWTGVPGSAPAGDVSVAATLFDLHGLQTAGLTLPAEPTAFILTPSSITEAGRLLAPVSSVDQDALTSALTEASELLTMLAAVPVDDVDIAVEEAGARVRGITARILTAALGPFGTSTALRVAVETLTASALHVTARWVVRTAGGGESEVGLTRHQEQVADWVLSDARAAGTDPDIAHLVSLAGRLHDEGKADVRFQRMLAGDQTAHVSSGVLVTQDGQTGKPRTQPLLAKSIDGGTEDTRSRRLSDARLRRVSGLPEGWRHEGASVAAVPDVDGADLVRHLVGSHHGWYRPAFQPVEPDQDQGFAHAAGFLELNAEYGPWGLAYLEAVLRLADWRASALPHDDDDERAPSAPDARPPSPQQRPIQDATPRASTHQALPGLETHPLTGWFAVVGLLGAAEVLGDRSATVRWDMRATGSAPTIPVIDCAVPLDHLVRAVLHSPLWDDAQQQISTGTGSSAGLGVKNQKLAPAVTLRSILAGTANEMLLGLVGDLGRAVPAGPGGKVELPIVPFANNSSYPAVALRRVGAAASVDSTVAALLDPNAGYDTTTCDGGMDRPLSAVPKDTGLGGVGDERITRAHLAPLAVAGMALSGTTGAQPLGLNRRSRPARLRLPLPTRPTGLDELRSLLVGAWSPDSWQWSLIGNTWVLELEQSTRGKSDISWQGRAVRRDAQ